MKRWDITRGQRKKRQLGGLVERKKGEEEDATKINVN